MPFDPNTLSPEARAAYRAIGARYDSSRTRAQAERTRNGALKILATHGERFAHHGVYPSTITELEELMEAQVASTSGRELVRTQKKATNVAYVHAIFDAKNTRVKLHSTYTIARRSLFEAGDKEAVRAIDAALDRTRSAADDADLLVTQLEVLGAVLKITSVRQAVAKENESIPATLEAEVAERIAILKSASMSKAGPRGTPIDSELVDVIDGAIVTRCREVRRAARALARELGVPALADEVELEELYANTRRGKKIDPEPSGEAPPAV